MEFGHSVDYPREVRNYFEYVAWLDFNIFAIFIT